MTKVNSEDFGQPVMTGEPLTPENAAYAFSRT